MYFLNVHGYQGHSGNNVFQMLKACFPEVEIISPQLVNKPSIDFSTLKRIIINKADYGIAFGKSLGGFYVCHLNKMFNMPCICINPSFEPWINNVFEDEDLEFLYTKIKEIMGDEIISLEEDGYHYTRKVSIGTIK